MFNNQYYELDETSDATFDDEDVKKLIKERDSYLNNKKKSSKCQLLIIEKCPVLERFL